MQHRKGIKNMVSLSTEPTDDEGVTGTGRGYKIKKRAAVGQEAGAGKAKQRTGCQGRCVGSRRGGGQSGGKRAPWSV